MRRIISHSKLKLNINGFSVLINLNKENSSKSLKAKKRSLNNSKKI
jgi:hypothetical protein